MTFHAVISGAGIAGPALAHQLNARGWRTTVIERYPQRRDEGQNVDIRGAAREVIARMGIDDAVRAAHTTEVGTRFVRADGSVVASFPAGADGDGPTAELEILRGELSRILVERTQGQTDYRFGATLADIVSDGERATAVLQDGTTLDADIVVIAEGLHSRSRRFVAPATVAPLGMYFAYVTLPRRDDDDRWWRWQHASRSRGVHVRPDNVGTMRAILTFISDVRGIDDLDTENQIAILRSTFADAGGAAPRILDALDAGAPMYFSAVGQVQTPTWSRGRVTLLGDTAFCNGTFGGAGTSLALIGAYILAGELAATSDHRRALTRYEELMKPFVGTAPNVSTDGLRMTNPRTRNGIRLLRTGARVMASPIGKTIGKVAGRGFAGGRLPLPDYPVA